MEICLYRAGEREENAELLASLLLLEERCFSDPWSRGMMQSALADPSVLLLTLRDGALLIGYMMLMTVFPDGEILNLAVMPEYRRQGLAEQLFDACLAHCQEAGIEMLFLEVRASNTPAVSLYEKQGFVTVGRRKNYYRYPKEDALVMRLLRE
ncbi:MAG: ribosomal protein S18-alanine N-acetyltransferase [Clostridia bacterium]|nr:ribosomal protein S18-alanine N-acetyltransferase [Clostridia bacterium]